MAEQALLKHFQDKIQRIIRKRKWHDTAGRAHGLALLILREEVHGLICKRCKGHGIILTYTRENNVNYQKHCEYCND